MALPADFPPPPNPPPASVPLNDEAWRRYHYDLNRWLRRLKDAL